MSEMDAIILRVRRRAIVLGAVAALGAFALGSRAGASLTICAAVVISSFLVLEYLPGGAGWKFMATPLMQ